MQSQQFKGIIVDVDDMRTPGSKITTKDIKIHGCYLEGEEKIHNHFLKNELSFHLRHIVNPYIIMNTTTTDHTRFFATTIINAD